MTVIKSLERCMTVLNGGIPDRIPVCLENFMHAANVGGYTVEEYCNDGEKMAAAHIAAWEKFGHDMIDLENGVCALAGAVGCKSEYFGENAAPWVTKSALESFEQIDELKPIDPYQDGTLPEMIKATQILAKELGKHVCVLAEADQGPFSLACQIIDPQTFLMSLLDSTKQEQIHQLLDYTTEQMITYARALIDSGAHITMMGESISGPDILSPKMYMEFAYPYEKRVVETLLAEGKRIGLHICGNATRIIEPMADTGAVFLQVDYKIDHAVCKKATQGKTTIIGTVDPSAVLALGTADDVSSSARSDIDYLANDGGFILSPGCSLPHNTPDKNIESLVQAAHSFGQYN